MKKFKNIVVPGDAELLPSAQLTLQKYSQTNVIFPKRHYSGSEVMQAAHNADAIIVPWHTPITKTILAACSSLAYIGATSTTLKGIDTAEAESRGITVTNISRYGNGFVAKFVFDQLNKLDRNLSGKTLGVIGSGEVGSEVAAAGIQNGMHVLYTGPTRKATLDGQGAIYTSLEDLLISSDVVTLHTPRDMQILGNDEFKRMRSGTILVDTAVGNTIEDAAFRNWIADRDNRAIFDLSIGKTRYSEYELIPNVITVPVVAGFTPESNKIRCQKIIENVEHYLRTHDA